MTEFETFKTLLDRIGDEYKITEWKVLDQAWIEDLTTKVTFEFVGGKLTYINNDKE